MSGRRLPAWPQMSVATQRKAYEEFSHSTPRWFLHYLHFPSFLCPSSNKSAEVLVASSTAEEVRSWSRSCLGKDLVYLSVSLSTIQRHLDKQIMHK